MLFDQIDRTSTHFASNLEPKFDFYNRISGEYWADIRELLEAWFERFPDSGRRELRQNFRSRDNTNHDAAFWELYVHQAFSLLNFEASVHPNLASSPNRPDFLMTGAQSSLYVEALTVHDDDSEKSIDKVRGSIVDAINERVRSDHFRLGIEFESDSLAQPPTRRLCQDLSLWLRQLEKSRHDLIPANLGAVVSYQEKIWLYPEWRIRFTAMLITDRKFLKSNPRIILFGPSGFRIVDDHTQFGDSLRRKASRYGELDKPFVLALQCTRIATNDGELALALFGGTTGGKYSTNGVLPGDMPDDMNGLWASRNGPRARGISAVLSGLHIAPHTVASASPKLFLNPWATMPLEFELPFQKIELNTNTGVLETTQATMPIHKFMGLSSDWPKSTPFPVEGHSDSQ